MKNTFWGSDAEVKHYPTREYLHKTITQQHRFPLWTEKVLFGFPLYADMEHAYLNVVNIASILIFGAVTSFKITHFLTFMAGALSFYELLRRKGYGLIPYTAAIAAYYFSFFHLNHLIHYNLISISMLLPLNILLADLFIEKKEKKLIIFQALVVAHGVYWGHPQTTILISLAVLLYVLVVGQNLRTLTKIKYLAAVLALSIGFALPQLYPTFRLFLASSRNIDAVQTTQGSLTPELSASYIFPYIFSTWPYYYGKEIDARMSYTELYNYLGIVTLALGSVFLVFGKRDKIFWFCYSLVWVFLILGYLEYLPFVNAENLPVVMGFRYWTRSIVLVSFALSILVAKTLTLEEFRKPKFNVKAYLPIALPAAYLALLHLINLNDPYLLKIHNELANLRIDLILKRDVLVWLVLPAASVVWVYAAKTWKGKEKLSTFLLGAIVVLLISDLRYFGNDPLTYRILKWYPMYELYFPKEFEGTRVVEENYRVEGMMPLLTTVNTPYGYSQFTSKGYNDFFNRLNLGKTPRSSYESGFLREELNFDELKKYGVSFVRTQELGGIYPVKDATELDFFREKVEGKYLVKKEGHVKVTLNTKGPADLHTTIKYDPNWVVKVNGERVVPEIWDEIFIKLSVGAGVNTIEFTYIPFDIIYGFVGGFGVVGGVLALLRVRGVVGVKKPKKRPEVL
jgi:hypothetical protein